MTHPSDDKQKRKKAIFDSMSPRRQQHILKKGYDAWDPFVAPQDPIDIRRDKTKRTSQGLITEFFHSVTSSSYSNAYGRGAFEICMGIINDDERYRGMYDFACWYQALLKKEGHDE